jgi:ATP-dependent protease HslVU (ClpYQ) peptidase subunit
LGDKIVKDDTVRACGTTGKQNCILGFAGETGHDRELLQDLDAHGRILNWNLTNQDEKACMHKCGSEYR